MTPVNNYRFSPQFVSNASELRASSSLERKTFTIAVVGLMSDGGSFHEMGSEECVLRVYNAQGQEIVATRVDDFAIHRFSAGVLKGASVSKNFSLRIPGSTTWMKTDGLRVVLEAAAHPRVETSFKEIESACCENPPSSNIPTISEGSVLKDFFLLVVESEEEINPSLTLRINCFCGPKSSFGSSFRA